MAWVMRGNIRAINPFPVKGQLGIYEVDVLKEKLMPRESWANALCLNDHLLEP